MILLEYNNRIIQETLERYIASDRKELLDVLLADFDGVKMHISTPNQEQRNVVTVSIQWNCIKSLLANGGSEDLKAMYGAFVQATPESGYDVTLKFDIDNITSDKEKFPEAISLLKRHLLGAPFKKVFQAVEKGQTHPMIVVDYREGEAIYIKGDQERVTIVYSINFKDQDDQVLAKTFLQEFSKTTSGAPSVAYSQKEAPGELKGVAGVKEGEGRGFVTFVLFKNHFSAQRASGNINNLMMFRDYLHYHIKCSKAHLHSCMRERVSILLQILNRAKPSEASAGKEKKTAAGKTFVRK